MYDSFDSALNIFVSAAPYGLALCLIPSFISWVVWFVINIFKSSTRG